jgi:hypothetical protein
MLGISATGKQAGFALGCEGIFLTLRAKVSVPATERSCFDAKVGAFGCMLPLTSRRSIHDAILSVSFLRSGKSEQAYR